MKENNNQYALISDLISEIIRKMSLLQNKRNDEIDNEIKYWIIKIENNLMEHKIDTRTLNAVLTWLNDITGEINLELNRKDNNTFKSLYGEL